MFKSQFSRKPAGPVKSSTLLVPLLCVLLFPWTSSPAATNRFSIPDGFTITAAATEPLVRFPMFAVFDDVGRLYVAESSGLDLYAELSAQTRRCRIRQLEDLNGDGIFESSRIFAERLVFPMGLAWRNGKLYVADPPDLITLQDTDDNGAADIRSVILSGFGHTDNGSLHGLIFGPDHSLYMTMGEPDGYKFVKPDGSILQGKSGALIRCRPDGSNVEVLCRGFENLVELIFTPSGDMIGTDNWFQVPREGLRDALVHLVDGGLYPYAPDSGTPQPITGILLPPVALYPAVALSGLDIYRGTAFPAPMRGNLFSAQHNSRNVSRHQLLPHQSTFRSVDSNFLTSNDPDFHPSDVLEDADGSLLVLDTGSWYIHHCPTGRIRQSPAAGGIYRIRYSSAPPILDPRGRLEPWGSLSISRLIALLEDSRPFVRQRAELELARHNPAAAELLAQFLAISKNPSARLAALWNLAAFDHALAHAALLRSLSDPDPQITRAAARACATLALKSAAPHLELLAQSDHPHVQLAAALALAKCGRPESVPLLFRSLEKNPDPFLEHALVYALHFLATPPQLTDALTEHSHPRSQQAALILLSQPPRPAAALAPAVVFAKALSPDSRLRQTACQVFQSRPDWTPHAARFIEESLQSSHPQSFASIAHLILAFESNPDVQSLAARALSSAEPAKRTILLSTLLQTKLKVIPSAWIDALKQSLAHSNPELRLATARTIAALDLPQCDSLMLAIAGNPAEPSDLRLAALRALSNRRPPLSSSIVEFLLNQSQHPDLLTKLAATDLLRRFPLAQPQPQNASAIRPPPSPTIPLNSPSPQPDTALQEAQARLAQFMPLLQGGRPEAGRALFFHPKSACSSCHAIGDQGGSIGPDLTRIGAIRSGRDILESILFPSSTFAQGYAPVRVITLADDESTGFIVQQSPDSLLLRDASGAERRFLQSQIRQILPHTVSSMPEGLETGLSPEEFRDLLAFLQNLR